ncbi:hypothetical protein [Desertibacillus haloalkaliphilus]|uniref:hypothetical protein n=1 Tax=Desertibacillus haloalkaliphilus TaxID=1328930 RepID=UPI001C263D8A|nr:hypothetical protein [Desertibacillus haloalkaliphilus]MBU8906536.1 hypothetical protein [Desertibacillus haloalkaliphilus]
MRPGHINNFTHLSQFQSKDEFNETIRQFLKAHGDQFTKSEKIAFERLTRFSIKILGVCNARIAKLVAASEDEVKEISRSTFERMLRKAKALGIITIHHTNRDKGGYSHSVYVFQPFDGAKSEKLTERGNKPNTSQKGDDSTKLAPETKSFKQQTNNQNHRLDNEPTLDTLDHTYVPSSIPTPFINAVKPFFNQATKICALWDRANIAYRSAKLTSPVQEHTVQIIKAFKETVFKYKSGKIHKSFMQYFYGAMAGVFVVEKRREMAEVTEGFCGWLLE